NDVERINRLFASPRRRKPRPKLYVPTRAIICPVISDRYYNTWTLEVDSARIKHDDSFMGHQAIASPRLPAAVAMKYRSISFGKGNTNDIPLDALGHCNYISPKHAVLFYDEVDHCYELLNYSCYGTYVDNALAANDEICKHGKEDKQQIIESEEEHDPKRIKISPLVKRSCNKQPTIRCGCSPSSFEALTSGWEGSLTVKHGSVLRFGCMSFVFSVVDNSTEST
ncbi:hypothetical protein ILUMI_09906, partial [Ignelater luminosus]